MDQNLVEIVGYAASIAVAASLMMTRIVRLRWWNLAGALAFTTYGALLGAWPVFAVNLFIAGVNVWFLWQLARRRETFETLPIPNPDNRYLQRFLSFYGADIRRFFPEFDLDRAVAAAEGELHIAFTLRDLVPVGLVVYELRECRRAIVHLDYVVPDYRDLRNARFLYREMAAARAGRRVHELVAHSWHPDHDGYLRRLGFTLRSTDGARRVYACAPAACLSAAGPLGADAGT